MRGSVGGGGGKNYPLIDFEVTEKQALEYCYSKGFDFGGLYKYYSRVSCWCCPLQKTDSVRVLYFHFPHLWQQLKEWESKTFNLFRYDKSLENMEVRFELEKERTEKGLTINPHTKEWREAYKKALADKGIER